MTDEELIRMYMLMHGHNLGVKVLEYNENLVNLGVLLASNQEYEKCKLNCKYIKPKLILRDCRTFLREKLVLHRIPYADEKILKDKIDGKIIRNERDLVRLYNSIGYQIDPFDLPVKFEAQPYYYGNVSLLVNLSDDEEFLKKMKIFFKSIELSNKTNCMTGVCYVHEIMHTQVESIKGIVEDFYNGELLSIFMELLYADEKDKDLFGLSIKNRIDLFFYEFYSWYLYINNNEGKNSDRFRYLISCKYIVSSLKAFHLYSRYLEESEIGKSNILWMIQNVISGITSLEEMLKKLDISYENSLNEEYVLKLIRK